MQAQERLEELLKKKGIGPQGSKSLHTLELEEITLLMKHPEVSLTTKTTILTALLTLEPNEDEKEWLEKLKIQPEKKLPPQAVGLISTKESDSLYTLIRKIINHSELSEEECKTAIKSLLDPAIPDYLKGPFLEAERLKRETFAENKAFFSTLWNASKRESINLPLLIDICDSYDGSNRTPLYSVFTAALLASAGFPTLIHGIERVAPKNGITSHQILKKAKKNPLISMATAKNILMNKEIGWAYLDQAIFFPALEALTQMRKEMVKRPFLATFEKLLQPIQNTGGNLLVTGFTHPHYREELVKQLKAQNECAKAIVLKGTEGSTQLSLSKESVCVFYDGSIVSDQMIHPKDYAIEELERKTDKSITAETSLHEGLAALGGEKNYAYHNILYSASLYLEKFTKMNKVEIRNLFTKCLDSGKAKQHWDKGQIS
ncbi:MAG: hypothetical protein ACK4ND_01385 [Cytophagaceae bacterium]